MATNTVHATYQEIYDLSTRAGTLSIVGIHTPQGRKPYHMLEGFFRQFKKVRYNGISKLVLQPAAQLPADPLQVSLEAGQTLDPRDLLNPILYHGAHGTDINAALNVAYKRSGFDFQSNSTDTIDLQMFTDVDGEISTNSYVEQMYYRALSDPSFRKYGVQQVVQLGPFTPMVHRVNSSMYFGPHYSKPELGVTIGSNGVTPQDSIEYQSTPYVWNGVTPSVGGETLPAVAAWQQFFTNGMAPLDWMPTRTFHDNSTVSSANEPTQVESICLPKLYMGILIFPPSYNQRLYFRMVITHSFSFRDFGTFQPYNINTASGQTSPNDYYENLQLTDVSETSMSLNLSDADAVLETSGVM